MPLPLWVTCAQSPNHVIDLVLSVYVRRGRLPEPGDPTPQQLPHTPLPEPGPLLPHPTAQHQ